jgi:glycosyltransferase involved in cell wall biosynthesis
VTRRSIVQVTLWNSPYLGNFMSCELALAAAVQAELGLGTHFVLADGAQGQPWLATLDAHGATWSVLPASRTRWRAHLARVVEDHAAAIVHTHFSATDVHAALVAARVCVPCIWHSHTGLAHISPKQRARDLLKWRILARRSVARVIAVSPWLGELARRRGAPAERIEVLPNPVTLERFARLPDRSQARERFGLATDADVVLGLGWWPEVKGVDVLCDALERVAERHPALQALLVGEEQMRCFLAQRLPVRPSWLRTSGFVEDAAWLFSAADIFVSASRHEGQSAAIGEALACGLQVVMSDIAGTAGWALAPRLSTFPSEDASTLAAALDGLLAQSADARAAAGGENREWANAHLGPQRWCQRLCEIYASLLDPISSVD